MNIRNARESPLQETFLTIRGCPFTIAHLSDLHDSPFGNVERSLRRNHPDIICVTGDFVNARQRPDDNVAELAEHILPFFEMCAAAAPTFVSLGNHEWMLTDRDYEQICRTGAQVLDGSFVSHRGTAIGGLSSSLVTQYRHIITEAGLNDIVPYPGAADITSRMPPDLDWMEAFCTFPGYRLLLCHHPEYYGRWLIGRDISLVLSGHAHGGQVRLFGRGLYAPGQGFLPRLTNGAHFGRLVISRGLSNVSLIPRLFNPPEIIYIRP